MSEKGILKEPHLTLANKKTDWVKFQKDIFIMYCTIASTTEEYKTLKSGS
jgi:hypothetical protein